jgi:hypothetical protein
LAAYLCGLPGVDSYPEHQYDFLYNLNGETIRLSFPVSDEKKGVDPTKEDDFTAMTKVKLDTLDLRFPNDSYDVRLALAAEKSVEVPFGFDKKNYHLLRKKVGCFFFFFFFFFFKYFFVLENQTK